MTKKSEKKKSLQGSDFVMIILLLVIIFIFIVVMFIFKRQQVETYASEEWVKEYLSGYELTELDIQVISKNLSDQLEEQIKNLKLESGLSENEIRKLMKLVNNELQYAEYAIPQDEITKLTTDIVKSILQKNMTGITNLDNPEIPDYESIINELAVQLELVRNALNEIHATDTSEITIEDIKNIVSQSGLDENTVKGWLQEQETQITKEDRQYTDDKISELAKQLGIDEQTLEQLITESTSHEDSLAYLANKLDMTEGKLNELLAKYQITDVSELYTYINQLKNGQANLQKQIDNNMSLTSSSITSISNQVADNKRSTDTVIATNKANTDAAIAANKTATEKQIAENKEYTDSEIKELQQNVLFYRYDDNTQTLYLFEKPEGE